MDNKCLSFICQYLSNAFCYFLWNTEEERDQEKDLIFDSSPLIITLKLYFTRILGIKMARKPYLLYIISLKFYL